MVHNLCKDISKTDGRTDGQTYATTISLCQNWPGVIKTQMAFHSYQSGLLDFKKAGETERGKWNEIISVNLFRVTVWGWYIWRFTSLPARNRSLETDICDKTKLDFKKAGETERGKWNEIISVNLFRVTVWGWYIWCFTSLPARNRSLGTDMSKHLVVKLCSHKTVLTRTGGWTKIYFVIGSRYNCQSTLYHNDKTIYFATYLMC